jgi:hypothetical protein
MIRLSSSRLANTRAGLRAAVALLLLLMAYSSCCTFAQEPDRSLHSYFIDCSRPAQGDGTSEHPWNSIAAVEAHAFTPGDSIAFARGTVCRGTFTPSGSGTPAKPIRLTAYGKGPRPRIVASNTDLQVLGLSSQEYWQIDSLDLSGANHYGIFITGDKGTLHHLYLKNLYVHEIRGGEVKNKDNGLVVVGASSHDMHFDDVLVDGVDAAHTNQWAGILIGGGNFGMDMPLNQHVTVRNSSVHDVYGDGIVLFRDSDGVIETSAAWETGMQPTESVGTPNAIWTWTCTDCIVRDNEAFLTDSPGVDGGAYDIDWNNTRNIVERNYGHDTQGYCIAVFAAGYVTSDSIVRDNLCTANALSPRQAAQAGALYIYTWNNGVIRGLRIENNRIEWNPPVSTGAAIVDHSNTGGESILFTGNRIESQAPFFYNTTEKFAPSSNSYSYFGKSEARFTLGERHEVTLGSLQAAGFEKGSKLDVQSPSQPAEIGLRLDATIDFALDGDGLLAPAPRAQILVLRTLAAQYGNGVLTVTVHLHEAANPSPAEMLALANALGDLNAHQIQFAQDGQSSQTIQLRTLDGRLLNEWHGFQNAAALGDAIRARVGQPQYATMEDRP